MWPVDEMGRNSVIPSTIARMMTSRIDILEKGRFGQIDLTNR